jgi:outer membrane lipoprotein-sorting protein
MRLWAALILLLPQEKAEDKAAEELLKSMRERLEQAKTVRAESTTTAARGARTFSARSSIKIKGSIHWTFDYELRMGGAGERVLQKYSFLCDGRKVVLRGPAVGVGRGELKTGEMATELRRSLASAFMTRLLFGVESAELKAPTAISVKDGGKEKVGDREAQVVEFVAQSELPETRGSEMKVRVFVDLATKLPLKREIIVMAMQWTETFTAFALDEDLPDSDFTVQSKRALASARAAQLATSVRLFGLYTGRHPEKLEDLVKRPEALEADLFWPEHGFLLGSEVPRDPWGRPFELVLHDGRVSVVSRDADGKNGDIVGDVPPVTRRATGAPTERLRKHYIARIEIQLLAAAIKAYRDSYGELPKKKAALWEKPEWAEVWPEGGWLPGGAVPVDPWGEPYRIISDVTFVRVQVKDPKSLALGATSLTAEERTSLEEIARPRLTAAERKTVARLIDQLGEDDLDARERAEGELKAMGPAIVSVIDERLKNEKGGETALRLEGVRKSIPARRSAWMSELAPLMTRIRTVDPSGGGPANELSAPACLKTLATAEADFRANDRDQNHINDFWTGDVASLYTLVPEGAKDSSIMLIDVSIALADAAPLDEGAALEKYGEQEPRSGYWFRVMVKDHSETPPVEYQQETTGKAGAPKARNHSRFGFCCYPAEYGVTGKRTFIINEANTIFWKDTGGEPVLEWPSDAELRRSWTHAD